MDGFWLGVFVVAVIGLIVNGLLLLRPAPPLSQPFGGRKIGFSVDVPMDAAFAAATTGVDGAALVNADKAVGRALFGDRWTFTSWGFYYLVDFTRSSSGGTNVSVAIRSKGFQMGPLVTRAQKKMADKLQAAIRSRAPRA